MPTEALPLGRNAELVAYLGRHGLVNDEALASALARCDAGLGNLAEVLLGSGVVAADKLLKALSACRSVCFLGSFEGLLDPEAAGLLPERIARKHLVVPIRRMPEGLLLGMLDAGDVVAMDTASSVAGQRVLPVLTSEPNLRSSLDRVYGEAGAKAAGGPRPAAAVTAAPAGSEDSLEVSVIDVLEGLFAEAVETGASDIHLEPGERFVRVRCRVDGLLQDRKVFPRDFHSALVARVKILSRLDITESRLPQDGHIRYEHAGRGVDMRVSTLPSLFGETVVIRILDHTKGIRRLSELGMPARICTGLQGLLARPTGLILVTGPTGSGKTTTLYAALNQINTQEKNIVTLEDPIEYRLAGITQTEASPKIGLTFAAGLRAILRQDPNVILVGEIRDAETAEIAVQAAITGHLVLSTLHTKDAAGTVARLLNMRIPPFLLAAALSGVLAQRLVRVLCPKCKKPARPLAEELSLLGGSLDGQGGFHAAAGCPACFDMGYVGRVALYEWLETTEEIRRLVLSEAGTDEIARALRAKGMRTLQEDGLEKARRGMTSLAEVIRVTHEER